MTRQTRNPRPPSVPKPRTAAELLRELEALRDNEADPHVEMDIANARIDALRRSRRRTEIAAGEAGAAAGRATVNAFTDEPPKIETLIPGLACFSVQIWQSAAEDWSGQQQDVVHAIELLAAPATLPRLADGLTWLLERLLCDRPLLRADGRPVDSAEPLGPRVRADMSKFVVKA